MTLNKNMLSPHGFAFNIKKTPELSFFVQAVNLPGINIGNPVQATPFRDIPIPGDKPEYGTLDVTFKVNEDMGNYIEIHDWIRKSGFLENFDQHKELADAEAYTGEGLTSDATLSILSSSMTPIVNISISDLFPVSLTDLSMDARDTSVEYIESTVSFQFRNYYFTPV